MQDVLESSGFRDDFRTCHPSSALLVVEVAVTTTDLDQAKSAIYAQAAIAQYVLVMPEQKQVVVFQNFQDTSYAESRILGPTDLLSLPGICDTRLDLCQLFTE